jgi:hypothetical protein
VKKLVIFLISSLSISFAKGNNSKLHFLVDERMELLTTIQYLSDYPILSPADLDYKKEVAFYFKDFKNHPAVQLNRKIYRRYFAYDTPPNYLYHFSFPDFKQIYAFSKEDLEDYEFDKHTDTLLLLLEYFKDFYQKSQFHKFYLSHGQFYASLVKPVSDKVSETDVVSAMEKYYGQENQEYNIVLTPMLHDGGYALRYSTTHGDALYAVIGPKHTSKGVPEFDMDNILQEYVIHEFSHSFCNPLIDKYWSLFEKDTCLLRSIIVSQREQGYGQWKSCVIEHYVRANEIILAEIVSGKPKADQVTKEYEDDQWIYLRGLIAVIKNEYVSNRSANKTQESIMPQIAGYFDNEAAKCGMKR